MDQDSILVGIAAGIMRRDRRGQTFGEDMRARYRVAAFTLANVWIASSVSQAAVTAIQGNLDGNGKVETLVLNQASAGAKVTTPGGHQVDAYIDVSKTPYYESPTDTYAVPVVLGTPVSAPDPAAVSTGDATPKTKIVGKSIVAHISGTNIVQLANGTWTNYGAVPSSTLAAAARAATPPATDQYAGGFSATNASQACTYGVPIPGTYDTTNYQAHITTPIFFRTGSPTAGYSWDPAGQYVNTVAVQTGPAGSVVGAVPPSGCVKNQMYLSQASTTNPQITYFADNPYNANDHWLCYSTVTVTHYGTYNAANFTLGGGSLTSSGLGVALSSSQSGWGNNGLAEDYQKAAEQGGGASFDQGTNPPTDADINDWKSTNQQQVDNKIGTGISSGSTQQSTDGSGTGAQTMQEAQFSGLQNTLNKILDAVSGDDNTSTDTSTYNPSSSANPYTLNDVDFGARFTEFTTAIKATSFFSLPNSAFSVPSGGTSTITINGGNLFNSITIDLADMSSAWLILRSIVLTCSTFIGIRIVCLKGGA